MNKFTKLFCYSILLTCAFAFTKIHAQKTMSDVPIFGAQIFIEPGQTEADIDTWFRMLKENGMKTTRIRMFESYMHKTDGNWNFNLFDTAFRAAEKYSSQNARYDWQTFNHFANMSEADYGVTISNLDCSFFKLGRSSVYTLDENASQTSALAGGQKVGRRRLPGIPEPER